MSQTIYVVDAFAERRFVGNPAAVCLLEEPEDENWMQQVAMEMNLAETAFLYPEEEGYRLRWFTPTLEVDLCGHATLAAAHILWETGTLPAIEEARFHTRSGVLTARHEGCWIVLDFPAEPESPAPAPVALHKALGVPTRYVGKNRFDYLIEVDSETTVRNLNPDHMTLVTVPCRGVIVTARSSTPGIDFVSRFFAPAAGINEDPVTGSAHCCLGPTGRITLGKSEFTARQISRRGGTVRVTVQGDRVLLGGQAITTLRGELL